jgi:shikimate dehydrogenase
LKILSLAYRNHRRFLSMIKTLKGIAALEIRDDGSEISPLDLKKTRRAFSGTLIYTCRGPSCPREQIIESYERALNAGFDFLDIDFNDLEFMRPLVHKIPQKTILSFHDFSGKGILREDEEVFFGMDVAYHKLALLIQDVWEGFLCLKRFKPSSRPTILVFMGSSGEWSRSAYGAFGSPWSYFCAEGSPTAPGQFSLPTFKREFGKEAHASSALYGILGKPLGHSVSPRFHNYFFRRKKKDAIYSRFQAENLHRFFDYVPENLMGLSVTTPYKRSTMPYVKSFGYLVQASGVLNTLKRENGEWIGYNTDALGIRQALDLLAPTWKSKSKIVVLGAGAMARSALAILSDCKNRLWVRNRNDAKAMSLGAAFEVQFIPASQKLDLEDSVLIQATSAGMGNEKESPIPTRWLHSTTTLVECVYFPAQTALVKAARKKGAEVIPGLEVFIYQALEQQKIWFDGESFTRKEAERALR